MAIRKKGSKASAPSDNGKSTSEFVKQPTSQGSGSKQPEAKQLGERAELSKESTVESKEKKQDRKLKVCIPINNGVGVISISNGEQKYYLVRVLTTHLFTLTTFKEDGGDTCEVIYKGTEESCDCKGFEKRRECRHLDAIKTLLTKGLI